MLSEYCLYADCIFTLLGMSVYGGKFFKYAGRFDAEYAEFGKICGMCADVRHNFRICDFENAKL